MDKWDVNQYGSDAYDLAAPARIVELGECSVGYPLWDIHNTCMVVAVLYVIAMYYC